MSASSWWARRRLYFSRFSILEGKYCKIHVSNLELPMTLHNHPCLLVLSSHSFAWWGWTGNLWGKWTKEGLVVWKMDYFSQGNAENIIMKINVTAVVMKVIWQWCLMVSLVGRMPDHWGLKIITIFTTGSSLTYQW